MTNESDVNMATRDTLKEKCIYLLDLFNLHIKIILSELDFLQRFIIGGHNVRRERHVYGKTETKLFRDKLEESKYNKDIWLLARESSKLFNHKSTDIYLYRKC